MTVGAPTTCTATVTDNSVGNAQPATGNVSFNDGGSPGSFSPSGGMCTLASLNGTQSTCTITYTPSAIGNGTHVIQVQYGGDRTHAANSNSDTTFKVSVTARSTSTAVICSPGSVHVGDSTVCTATVTDTAPGSPSAPTGPVGFASDSAGALSAPGKSCTLVMLDASHSSCHVTYTPSAVGSGTHHVSASYGGSTVHGPSIGMSNVAVTTSASATTLQCSPSSVAVGHATTCTARVTGTGAPPKVPTGSVSFTTNSPGGFTPGACSLTPTGAAGQASCHVSYTPTASGSGKSTLGASYHGDASNAPSGGSAMLLIAKLPPPLLGKTVSVGVVSGRILIRTPGSKRFLVLSGQSRSRSVRWLTRRWGR